MRASKRKGALRPGIRRNAVSWGKREEALSSGGNILRAHVPSRQALSPHVGPAVLFAAGVCPPLYRCVFPPHFIRFQAVFHIFTYLGRDAYSQWHGTQAVFRILILLKSGCFPAFNDVLLVRKVKSQYC